MPIQIDPSVTIEKKDHSLLNKTGGLTAVGESYFLHAVLIILLIMLYLRNGESNTIGIAITACVIVIAVGTDNISRFSLVPKGIEFERVKELAVENADFIRTFVFMSMQIDIFHNLSKIASGIFGPFNVNENFRQQLRYLLDNGFIEFDSSIENLPDNGNDLSKFVSATKNGMDFVRIREEIVQMNKHRKIERT